MKTDCQTPASTEDLPLSAFLLTAWECTTLEDLGRIFPQTEQTCSGCNEHGLCYELSDANFPQIKYYLCLACCAHVLVAWCALVDGDEQLFHRCDESLCERFLNGSRATASNSIAN